MERKKATQQHLEDFTGKRFSDNEQIKQLTELIDALSCRDLLYVLTAVSASRAHDWTVNEALKGNRSHEPSVVDQRLFHLIDGMFFDGFPEVEFVELAPLQPFALNRVLTDISAKNVVSALRRSEVNADISTALFRLAFEKLRAANLEGNFRMAGHTRVTRSMSFDDQSKFLPHFRMFGQLSVGRETEAINPEFGNKELQLLAAHLAGEVAVLDRMSADPRFALKGITIELGNVAFMSELIEKQLVDPEEINKKTIDPNYDPFTSFNLTWPREMPLSSPDLLRTIQDTGITRGLSAVRKFIAILEQDYPDLLSRITFQLNRVAGAGYYKTICYHITGLDEQGEKIPLADGGSTKWGKIATNGNKKVYTVSSGIGTELLAQYFIRK